MKDEIQEILCKIGEDTCPNLMCHKELEHCLETTVLLKEAGEKELHLNEEKFK